MILRLSLKISQCLTTWGITGDMKKGDQAWDDVAQMLVFAGVRKPSVASVGPMLRWWTSGFARFLSTL